MTTTIDGTTGVSQIQAGAVQPDDLAQKLTSGTAQATTSGTAKDFTGIPAWAKRITVVFNGVSTNGSSNLTVRIGAGSIQATGYSTVSTTTLGGSTTLGASDTTGFTLHAQLGASDAWQGHMILTLVSGNTWVCSSVLGLSGSQRTSFVCSTVALSGALDSIRLTTINGTDTFDAGSVNILYE